MFNNIFQNKKVLITGDSGFKGSWLAILLLKLGANVYGYSLPPKTMKDNFVVAKLKEKIEHLDGDIRDYKRFYNYVKKVKPDFAFHLAAQPLVLDSYSDPRYTFETNILGTIYFFEAVRLIDSIRVAINVTSDKCYQNNEWIWGYRECDPLGGRDPYSASKASCEIVTQAYIHSYFMENDSANVASVRAGNVIGGGDWSDYRIVPDFFKAVYNNKSLVLRNPNATRPWQHVLEPLSGYLLLTTKLFLEGKKYSGAWNFGPINTRQKSVLELIKRLIYYTRKGSYIIEKSTKKLYETQALSLDISKAMNLLKWEPILDFEETVKLTVEGYMVSENEDIFKQRLNQINYYFEIAKKKNLIWMN